MGGASHGTLCPIRAFPFGCSFFFSPSSFDFLFSICHALLSCLNIYLICPIKSLKKKNKVDILVINHNQNRNGLNSKDSVFYYHGSLF